MYPRLKEIHRAYTILTLTPKVSLLLIFDLPISILLFSDGRRAIILSQCLKKWLTPLKKIRDYAGYNNNVHDFHFAHQ